MLLLVLQLATALQSPSLTDAERTTRQMQMAVEGGNSAPARAAVDAELRAAPGNRRSLLSLATLERLTYQFEAAERGYRLLTGHDDIAAHAWLGLGLLHLQEFQLTPADSELRRAAADFAALGDAGGEAQALSALASVLSRTSSLDSAAFVHQRALQRAPADPWLLPLLRCNAALVDVRRPNAHDGHEARAVARQARATAREALAAGNARAATACLAAVAQDFERRTLVDSAAAIFAEMAVLQRKTGNLSGLAITRQWQGFVLQMRGHFQEAREALTEAIALGEQTRTRAAAAWASLNLASISLAFGDLSSAGSYARSASDLFTLIGDRWGLMSARQNQGEVALANGSATAARAAFDDVVRLAPSVLPTMGVHALGRLASVSLLENDIVGAERELDRALTMATSLDMPEWANEEDAYARALIALRREDFAAAGTIFRTLLKTLPGDQLGSRADVHTRLAEVYLGQGQIAAAENALGAAAALVDSLRLTLSARDFQSAVLNARHLDWDRDLGFATVIDGLARAGRASAAFRLSEGRRARVLLEQLARRRSLTNVAGGGLPDRVLGDSVVRARLPDSTALLGFVAGTGDEPTTVFVLTREALRTVRAASIDEHMLELERFDGLVATGDMPRALARRLGAAFLHDAIALLPPGVTRLVVLPDGPLHRLPFDVVADADGRLLVERFAISFAPSASVAAAAWREKARLPGRRLVAFGDPTGVHLRSGAGDFAPPRLPAAAHEAKRVARFAEVAEVYTGDEARESRLRHMDMRGVSVLHFATHADVDEWSFLRSALLLAPGDKEDGALRGDELSALDLPVSLVVLSACRSAGGAVLAGEGLQGLTSPLLEAGASSVIASLWQIGDEEAADMVERIYSELATGLPVADALWRAKNDARRAGVSPAEWAAFTLTGDPRVVTSLHAPDAFPLQRAASASLAILLAVGVYSGVARTSKRRKADRR